MGSIGKESNKCFYYHGSCWLCIPTLGEQSKKETLTIPGYLNLRFHPCTRFFVSLRKLSSTCILHSFSLMTFLYRSIHYQPTTQVIGRKFRVSSIQEYSMSARVQNRTTRILRLQNVICEPRCFACNA